MSVSSITDVKQYLSFRLGEESFALDVVHVKEILEFSMVTKVPKTPEYMLGVINLRGSVVPVLDMRLKMGFNQAEITVDTCIVVVEALFDGIITIMGALVDSVQEVFELEPQNIEPVPRIGTQVSTEFIKGMGRKDDYFIIILDIDKVFSAEELAIAQGIEIMEQTNSVING